MATPPTNELTGPQTSVWHFGWNTPNSREYNANFRKMGLTIAQMWNGSDADAKLVDLSGDVPMVPGGGFPTEEQVLELRAKGAKVDPNVTPGGFGYLRGPDGVMIENAQSGTVERFNHVHMYHEHPACATQLVRGAPRRERPAGRGGAAGGGSAGDCQTKMVLAADLSVVCEAWLRARAEGRRALRRHLDRDDPVAGRWPRLDAWPSVRSLGGQHDRTSTRPSPG